VRICRATKQMHYDIPALIYNRVKREEMLKQHIEAKVRSG